MIVAYRNMWCPWQIGAIKTEPALWALQPGCIVSQEGALHVVTQLDINFNEEGWPILWATLAPYVGAEQRPHQLGRTHAGPFGETYRCIHCGREATIDSIPRAGFEMTKEWCQETIAAQIGHTCASNGESPTA